MIGFTYLAIREWHPGVRGKRVAIGLIFIILVIGMYHKHEAVYRDEKRSLLTYSFADPKLSGIKSTERNVRQVAGLISAVNHYTDKGDYIFVFPDFPVLYYLTGRKNPTRVEWPIFREIDMEMVYEMVDSLEARPPKLVLLQMYPEADFTRSGPKYSFYNFMEYKPLIQLFYDKYNKVAEVGDVYVLTPITGKI